MKPFLFLLFFLASFCFAINDLDRLVHDIQLVKKLEKKTTDDLPTIYSYNLMTGYFNMPSARMPQMGTGAFQYARVYPYENWSLAFQLFKRIELSATLHIFLGVPDVFLGKSFGDKYDRAANFKIAILLPEDSNYWLPGLSYGMNDFFGSQNFSSQYLVATQVIRKLNLELTLGYGKQRIKGIFGGVAYYPFRNMNNLFLKGLSLAAEYDHNDYTNPQFEPSPFGRSFKTRINAGAHYSLLDIFNFSVCSLRGERIAFAFNLKYNFDTFKGVFAKIWDASLYSGPANIEPIGKKRPYTDFVQEATFAFQSQGLTILKIQEKKEGDTIHFWLRLTNRKYRKHEDLKERICQLLANLAPENVDLITVQIENNTLLAYQFTYRVNALIAFGEKKLGYGVLDTITPMQDIKYPKNATTLFKQNKSLMEITARPRLRIFFGSAAGKVKYDLGFLIGPSGYIMNALYYKAVFGFNVANNLSGVKDYDKMNPSQIINVRSDLINYYRSDTPYVEKLYIQKNFSFGNGCFARLAFGYFEIGYGGIAGEFLYFPAKYNFAFGAEIAGLKKRDYRGLGFMSHIRRLQGITPTFEKYTGLQYFFNAYYDWKKFKIDTHIQIGQFLAKDRGIKATFSRYFDSGLRLSFWIGASNLKDIVNGKRYYEKGIQFSFPLDLFFPISSRHRFQTGGSEWLRDVVQAASTGNPLYSIIHSERRDY
jgi:hypothetical protein